MPFCLLYMLVKVASTVLCQSSVCRLQSSCDVHIESSTARCSGAFHALKAAARGLRAGGLDEGQGSPCSIWRRLGQGAEHPAAVRARHTDPPVDWLRRMCTAGACQVARLHGAQGLARALLLHDCSAVLGLASNCRLCLPPAAAHMEVLLLQSAGHCAGARQWTAMSRSL